MALPLDETLDEGDTGHVEAHETIHQAVNDRLDYDRTGATAPAKFVGGHATVAPTTGTHAVGDFIIISTGKIAICTVAGTPGTWVTIISSDADTYWDEDSGVMKTPVNIIRANSDAASTLQVDIGLVGPSGEPGILFAGRTGWFESAANTIKTEDALVSSGGSLFNGGNMNIDGNILPSDGRNFTFGTSVGTKIGTGTNQKLAFYDAAPIAQQTGVAVSAAGIHAALVSLGLITA